MPRSFAYQDNNEPEKGPLPQPLSQNPGEGGVGDRSLRPALELTHMGVCGGGRAGVEQTSLGGDQPAASTCGGG